jgi:hypothetical protein
VAAPLALGVDEDRTEPHLAKGGESENGNDSNEKENGRNDRDEVLEATS